MAEAPLVWSLSLLGEAEARVALQRLATDINDWRPFWDQYFGPAWFRHMRNQFETEGEATGQRWANLSPAYEQWKLKHYPGRKILERTGALKSSLTDRGDPGMIFDSEQDSLTLGTSVPYAIFHQLGTGRRGGASGRRKVKGYQYGDSHGMPARPPMRMGGDVFRLLVGKLLQQFAYDTAKKAGLA